MKHEQRTIDPLAERDYHPPKPKAPYDKTDEYDNRPFPNLPPYKEPEKRGKLTAAFGNEVEDKSLANLTLAPVPRWQIAVPKLLAGLAALALAGPWIGSQALAFFRAVLEAVPTIGRT